MQKANDKKPFMTVDGKPVSNEVFKTCLFNNNSDNKELLKKRRKVTAAWRKLVKGFERLHKDCRGKAEPLYRIMEVYLDAADNLHELELGIESYKMHKLMPSASTGLKIFRATSAGGKEASKLQEPKRNEIKQALKEYLNKNKNVSLTAARDRIAERKLVSRRSVERYTKGIKRN